MTSGQRSAESDARSAAVDIAYWDRALGTAPPAPVQPSGSARQRQPVSDERRGPFGVELRSAREDRGLSQSRLAALAGFDHSYVSRLESGERIPGRDAVSLLADALALTADDRERLFAAGGFVSALTAALLHESAVCGVALFLGDSSAPADLRDSLREQVAALTAVHRRAAGVSR